MTEPAEEIIVAFLKRFDLILAEYREADQVILDAEGLIARKKARQDELRDEAEKLRAAGDLFGFSLYDESERRMIGPGHGDSPPIPPTHIAPPAPPKIKDYVLQAAEAAYPNPVRAADLRQRLRDAGHDIHDKTIGMTLYRLSQEDLAPIRREGRDWYFVPVMDRVFIDTHTDTDTDKVQVELDLVE